MIGVDPGPLTLGKLIAMYFGRARHDWDQTARQLWQQANLYSKRPIPLKKFHPFYQAGQATRRAAANEPKMSVKLLKSVFVDRSKPEAVLLEMLTASHPEVAKALIPLQPRD